jgi:hypothetical protein
MRPTERTLPPFLSGNIVPDSYASSKQRRNRHADGQDSFSPLSGPGAQRGDARLDNQTWHTRLGWHQRLGQWYAKHCFAGCQRAVSRRLDDQWDALPERVLAPTIEGPLDCIARTHPSLRMVVYTSLT